MKISPKITATVWLLSFVSLFTDMASEMLYPIMPIFLKSIGFSTILIGILEGLAEAVAGLSKGYFGKMSDDVGKRLPFVRLGYGLSALSKPLMAVSVFPIWIFLIRTLDRIGKGIRTGARDSLLSAEATPETKGRVFGLHRAMDTLGAVLGPATALVFLYYYPHQYKLLFYLAIVPGIIAIACTWLLHENPLSIQKSAQKGVSFGASLQYWRESSQQYKSVITPLLIFALFNSSDVFLLLKIKTMGFSDTMVIGAYIFYNAVYALLAYPAGILADKLSFQKMIALGFCLYAVVYFGFSFSSNWYIFIALLIIYGFYAAATESIAKAWISNIVKPQEVATATGTFSAFQSIAALFASILCGFWWHYWGSNVALMIPAIISFSISLYLFGKKSF